MTTSTVVTGPGLQEATKKSTTVWRENLEALFHHAKDRFADVVWEVGDEDGEEHGKIEEIWGHKAIIYARAPPSFQTRYFSFRPVPYFSSPTGTFPTYSALSLDVVHPISRTPSPFRSPSSPAPSTTLAATATTPTNNLLRLSTSINPALFSNELEYLYTGQGFGEAFEFLFDSAEGSNHHESNGAEELRIDKLRKDLVFMWRSRLYSDVRIALSSTHDNTTAIFSSHRFILISRSPYFHTALFSWPSPNKPPVMNSQDQFEHPTLTLPSPPFTPASIHFTLGFIYTGTLVFSHRSYDLSTAFQILRSALYLSLPTLHDEIQARIVQEMLHGLFHAFLPFPEYERLTAGAWGTGGCRCRQCARRAPRVLEFALADDVKNSILERGARRALVGLFGEGWCTSEFAALPVRLRDALLRGLGKRTTPPNAFALLFAAEHALGRLAAVIDAWAAEVKEMVLTARKATDEIVCGQSEACFAGRDWNEIMERDGVAFEDSERVEWIMASVSRGVHERNAPGLYQTLVSSILLRPHPTETNAPMLPPTSHIRVKVEEARLDLLKWIGKRWIGIRQEGGFDQLEGWSLKEISDNIEVPLEDLIHNPLNTHLKPYPQPRASTLHRAKESESTNDTISMHSSMRVSILNRNLTTSTVTSPTTTTRITTLSARRISPPSSTASSYKSLSRTSVASSIAHRSQQQQEQIPKQLRGDEELGLHLQNDGDSSFDYSDIRDKHNSRPDSKLTPGLSAYPTLLPSSHHPSIIEPSSQEEENGDGDHSVSVFTPYSQLQNGDGDTADEGGMPSFSEITDAGDRVHIPSSSTVSASGNGMAKTTPGTSSTTMTKVARKVTPTSTAVRRSATANAGTGSPGPTIRPSSSSASIRSSASVSSVRSHVSTIRKSTVTSTSTISSRNERGPGHRTPGIRTGTGVRLGGSPSISPTSLSVSTATPSDDGSASGTFHTANSSVSTGRARRMSAASTTSIVSVRGNNSVGGTTTGPGGTIRIRKTSAGSTKSNIGGGAITPTKRRPPVPPLDTSKISPVVAGAKGITLRTTAGIGMTTARKVVGKRMTSSPAAGKGGSGDPIKPNEEKIPVSAMRRVLTEEDGQGESSSMSLNVNGDIDEELGSSTVEPPPLPAETMASKRLPPSTIVGHKKSGSTGSNMTLKRIGSTDTITGGTTNGSAFNDKKKETSTPLAKEMARLPTSRPKGATLEIGIPCIISSKRKRFKAYARYIGEVEGEDGPWVGVEVPVGDSWSNGTGTTGVVDHDVDGERQWHDGTWGGIRYFEIRGSGNESEWEYGDDRAARRVRLDWISSGSMSGSTSGGMGTYGRGRGRGGKGFLKREGEQLGVDSAVKRLRSVSPAVSDTSGMESRGLFVRPQQVLYVVDAVGSDL